MHHCSGGRSTKNFVFLGSSSRLSWRKLVQVVNDNNGKLYHFKLCPKNNNLISDNNQKTFCSYFDFFLFSFDFGFVRAFFLLFAPCFSENPILVLDYFDPSLAFFPCCDANKRYLEIY